MKEWKKLCWHIGQRTAHQLKQPYSLAFRIEAVLPLERQISFLRLVIQEGLTEEKMLDCVLLS